MKYRLKVVPVNHPDANGEWIEVEADELPKNKQHRWRYISDHFARFVPKGFFLAQWETPKGKENGQTSDSKAADP